MPRYLILDTETSGLPLPYVKGQPPPSATAEGQPRLASFTAIATTEDLEVDEDASIAGLVRADGWKMSPGATKVNGITDEMLAEGGLPVAEVLKIYAEFIDAGWIVVAHNVQFDAKVMRGELRRAGMDDRFMKTFTLCTQKASQAVIKEAPTHKMLAAGYKTFKQPKLQEAYEYFYGELFAEAHTAAADARACLAVLRKLKALNALPEPSILFAKSRDNTKELSQ